jgi:hypothetical protein
MNADDGVLSSNQPTAARGHWPSTPFIGTYTGPGGMGNQVRISAYEDWKIGPDGLIADSKCMTTRRTGINK